MEDKIGSCVLAATIIFAVKSHTGQRSLCCTELTKAASSPSEWSASALLHMETLNAGGQHRSRNFTDLKTSKQVTSFKKVTRRG